MWHENIFAAMQRLYPNARPAIDWLWAQGDDGPYMAHWNTEKLGPLDLAALEAAAAPPPPTRESVKAAIDAIWQVKHESGYPHDFGAPHGVKVLQTRESDQPFWLALAQVASVMVAQGQAGQSCGSIRTEDNANVPVTATEALAAMLGMQAYLGAILAHSWALKDQVTAAEDMDDVLAIDINAGWPV